MLEEIDYVRKVYVYTKWRSYKKSKKKTERAEKKGYNGYFYKGQVHVRQETVKTKSNAAACNMASFASTDQSGQNQSDKGSMRNRLYYISDKCQALFRLGIT